MPIPLTRRAVALLAAGLPLAGALAAAPQAAASPLYACVKKGGDAHVFTKKPKCKKGEAKVSWNSVGPAGKNGANGSNGTNGTNGSNGSNGETGPIGPSTSYQNLDASHTLPEPGGGLGTPINTLTLPAGTYLVIGTGTITRSGLSNGSSADQTVQLRRGGTAEPLAEFTAVCGQESGGEATASYSITRLVTVTGTSEPISLNAFDSTSSGTGSTAKAGALTATLVGSGSGAL
jgi:hypothetical protein